MTEDEDTPEKRLDRLLRRERRRQALLWGSITVTSLVVFAFLFGIKREPQGPEAARVLSRTQMASDDSVVFRYSVELPSGAVFRMSARAIHGIGTGDTICVQRLRHPVFRSEVIQRLPNSRCGLR